MHSLPITGPCCRMMRKKSERHPRPALHVSEIRPSYWSPQLVQAPDKALFRLNITRESYTRYVSSRRLQHGGSSLGFGVRTTDEEDIYCCNDLMIVYACQWLFVCSCYNGGNKDCWRDLDTEGIQGFPGCGSQVEGFSQATTSPLSISPSPKRKCLRSPLTDCTSPHSHKFRSDNHRQTCDRQNKYASME